MDAPALGGLAEWIGFALIVLALLAVDLGVVHREARTVGFKEALFWSAVWVCVALAFNAAVWALHGPERGLEFLTGYLIEKSLSVDNIFVFLVIFSYFRVPPAFQHRVLFWGILGALVMRAIFVAVGSALLHRFHAVIYVFGSFLILTGLKMLLGRDETMDPDATLVVRLFRRVVPMTPEYDGARFTVIRAGRRLATPLLLVLVAIEATDLVFAVDSVPAIFAVTDNAFIVYTSNIFAILGLRAMYFLLAGVIDRFHLLKAGLALVLIFVGGKMTLAGVVTVPVGVALGVVAAILAASVALSFLVPKRGGGSAQPR